MSNTDKLTEALVKFKKQRFRLEEADKGSPEAGHCGLGFDHQEHLPQPNYPRDEGLLYLLGGRGNKELVWGFKKLIFQQYLTLINKIIHFICFYSFY